MQSFDIYYKAGNYLELYDSLLGQTEVHSVSVLHVKSYFVQLRHRIISLKMSHLLVNLNKLHINTISSH